MFRYIRKLIPHKLRRKIKQRICDAKDMDARLLNLREAGLQPTATVDGGAFVGGWSQSFWSVWPQVPSYLIEPQPDKQETLSQLAATVLGSVVFPCVVAAENGRADLFLEGTNSRVAPDGQTGACSVAVRTLADIFDEVKIFPNLVKLDLQGHEMEALKGAGRRLKEVEVFILETSVIRIGDVPIFEELDQFMRDQGYRFYDCIPSYYRPRDNALWQMDVFYVRRDSSLWASRSWN